AFARGVAGEFKHRDPRFLRARGLAMAAPAAQPAAAESRPPAPPAAPAPAVAAAGRADESTFRIEQFPEVQELEQRLALATVSGHGVFVTVIGHIVQPGDLILHDSLAHDCIVGGAKLSGAKRRPFPHSDVEALERQLAQLRPHYRRVLIAVEGVYSMDGDVTPLPRIIELKKKYGALLLVDE